MKPKTTETLSASVKFVCALFVINFISCSKEAIVVSGNQPNRNIAVTNAALIFGSNEKIEIDLPVFISCANGGAGEDVLLTGTLHVTTSTTINDNMVRTRFQFQPQGISGTGSITGDKYQGTGVSEGTVEGSLINEQLVVNDVNNFRIIGQGNGNNFLIHDNFHIAINANGVLTVVIDNFTADCK